MKRLILSLSLLCMFASGVAWSADRIARVNEPVAAAMPSLEGISPAAAADVWLYEQEWRRYDDPLQAVRRNAEFKGAQRRYRLAALRWFGYSASRPVANPIPSMGVYSPAWAGSHEDPYRWVGGGYPTVAIGVLNVEE